MSPWVAYYEKPDNLRSRPKRAAFWEKIIAQTQPRSVLEVGCGDGLNLEHIRVPFVMGVDSYDEALSLARAKVGDRGVLLQQDARALRLLLDRSFDLAFTCTTLQHIADDGDCRTALRELIRVSRAWVLIMEYEADERTPIAWRGNPEGIVKRQWGMMLRAEGVTLVDSGFLAHDDDGFDDVTWYLGKRP